MLWLKTNLFPGLLVFLAFEILMEILHRGPVQVSRTGSISAHPYWWLKFLTPLKCVGRDSYFTGGTLQTVDKGDSSCKDIEELLASSITNLRDFFFTIR